MSFADHQDFITEPELPRLRRSLNFWRNELGAAERAMLHAHGEVGKLEAWVRVTRAREEYSKAAKELNGGA